MKYLHLIRLEHQDEIFYKLQSSAYRDLLTKYFTPYKISSLFVIRFNSSEVVEKIISVIVELRKDISYNPQQLKSGYSRCFAQNPFAGVLPAAQQFVRTKQEKTERERQETIESFQKKKIRNTEHLALLRKQLIELELADGIEFFRRKLIKEQEEADKFLKELGYQRKSNPSPREEAKALELKAKKEFEEHLKTKDSRIQKIESDIKVLEKHEEKLPDIEESVLQSIYFQYNEAAIADLFFQELSSRNISLLEAACVKPEARPEKFLEFELDLSLLSGIKRTFFGHLASFQENDQSDNTDLEEPHPDEGLYEDNEGYYDDVSDNPFYDDNLDLDQQSIGFWNRY